MAGTFQPMQINPHSPYNIGTRRPSSVYPYHSPVNTDIETTAQTEQHQLQAYNTHMNGKNATPTAHTYQTQHSTEQAASTRGLLRVGQLTLKRRDFEVSSPYVSTRIFM